MFRDKDRRSKKEREKRKKRLNCKSNKSENQREPHISSSTSELDKEAVNCQYLMAESFVKSILDWKCPIPKEEFKDIADVILKRLGYILDYSPVGGEDRRSQQMRFLADIVGSWIAGVLFEVAETRKAELEEECERRRKEADEESEDESDDESEDNFGARDDDDDDDDNDEDDDNDDGAKRKKKKKGPEDDGKGGAPGKGEDDKTKIKEGTDDDGDGGQEMPGEKTDSPIAEEQVDQDQEKEAQEKKSELSAETGEKKTPMMKPRETMLEEMTKEAGDDDTTTGNIALKEKDKIQIPMENQSTRLDEQEIESKDEPAKADAVDPQRAEDNSEVKVTVTLPEDTGPKTEKPQALGKDKQEGKISPEALPGETVLEPHKEPDLGDGEPVMDTAEKPSDMTDNSKRDDATSKKPDDAAQTPMVSTELRGVSQKADTTVSEILAESKDKVIEPNATEVNKEVPSDTLKDAKSGKSVLPEMRKAVDEKAEGVQMNERSAVDNIAYKDLPVQPKEASEPSKILEENKEVPVIKPLELTTKDVNAQGPEDLTGPKTIEDSALPFVPVEFVTGNKEILKDDEETKKTVQIPQRPSLLLVPGAVLRAKPKEMEKKTMIKPPSIRVFAGKEYTNDTPFVTFDQIFHTIYNALESGKENPGGDPITNRLHRAVYEKFFNVVQEEGPQPVSELTKDVLDVMSGKIALWLRDILTNSQLSLMKKHPETVGSVDVREWTNWICNVSDGLNAWSVWIQKTIRQAEGMRSGRVTRGDWLDWTKSVDSDALFWRRFYLESVHRAHQNLMMIRDRHVVKTGTGETKNKEKEKYEKEVKVTDLEIG